VAAVGGMAVPAAIYVAINAGNPVAQAGWAIPAATDIAFALGVLSLLGKRVPVGLKMFLLTLAILDDLGAIVIIALFYAGDLAPASPAVAAAALVALFTLNRLNVVRLAPYLFVGLVLWVSVLKSGVHATLAGVALAFLIPLRTVIDRNPCYGVWNRIYVRWWHWRFCRCLPVRTPVFRCMALDGLRLSHRCRWALTQACYSPLLALRFCGLYCHRGRLGNSLTGFIRRAIALP
jgi:Na+/H+ antiporter NhaA